MGSTNREDKRVFDKKTGRLQQFIDRISTGLREAMAEFRQGFLAGMKAKEGSNGGTISEFLNEPDSNFEWSEAEIMQWVKTLSKSDQRTVRKAARDARSRGQNPHEFLCQVRAARERMARERQASMVGGALDGWERFQADWLLTSAFIKDTIGGGLFK